ncbi:nitric oxide synthase-interacting protein-like [Mizuhopecten yessoensis]|uniref:nitric oxide synthase-interacting protein-like n=1 Tax=Mizuhopecten yessoensis TaxID=6573 RepID=UPI000B45EEBC|nr:nitric oxide synthase-interacting protein-like [Mizuhopecten yessoensis]XP_021377621.1 nitric oxide synthase-interacting protein-like [Mizuhopecten yessoensis]XP_021377624.1 nitric oxide synthase-interacting protein-like [Mizuhopecten yessoensis]XP_021377632.1 nitric oxide synthase-interacting protein-like [Mizuhopecten yessoensis]
MTRHSKNCTAGTVYSYHERKRDTSSSGYGTNKMRLGKDSVKEFDCCCLTLQPCKNPVLTPEGYLYDKEAVLEFILHQKKEIAKQLKKFDKQKNREQEELKELGRAELASKKQSLQISSQAPGAAAKQQAAAASSISNMGSSKSKELPSFWIPSMTPAAGPSKVKKPDEKVKCPMSGKPLRLKDLITVNFTDIMDRDSKTALITKQARYVCAVTNDVLGNSIPCAVLRPSGSVVTMECVEKIIKKDMLDPINGAKLREKDIIQLQRGASGFAAAGNKLEARKEGAVLMA